eukprot:TRINITY_DN815_c0_g2_i1.p2 TRINITY_DN815_c0_g2~~TRINITY_DN815_c0_g2_i1.p2  ORF type:complete len:293 (+),score=69.93 TRINITY_DN815_c0_g2_i1:144-1022(+)
MPPMSLTWGGGVPPPQQQQQGYMPRPGPMVRPPQGYPPFGGVMPPHMQFAPQHVPPQHVQQPFARPPQQQPPRAFPTVARRLPDSSSLTSKYDVQMQAPPPLPAVAVRKPTLAPSEQTSVQQAQGRTHWGVAHAPDGTTAAELPEWKAMEPGEARVIHGYEEGRPVSAKARALMDVYEKVMSRPTPGTSHDPRTEVPCRFWSAGRFCRNGDQCPWSHAGRRGGGGFFFQRSDPRSRIPCIFHREGRCIQGGRCPFQHKGGDGPVQAAPHDERPPPDSTAPPGSSFKGYMPPQ